MYLRGYYDLGTERVSSGMAVDQIPWSKAMQYAREWLGFDDTLAGCFWFIIRQMDGWYRQDQGRRFERERSKQRSKGSDSGSKKRGRFGR